MNADPATVIAISRRWRFVIGVFLIGHLIAVVGPPLAFQTRGPRGVSPSVLSLVSMVSGYGQFLYLDRGYAFFAPDPGPSHLIRATLEKADTDPETRVFPDLGQQWPRLLYHRHFMLSEFLNDNFQPALPQNVGAMVGENLPVEELATWRAQRDRYDRIASSMMRHLQVHHQVDHVALERVEHQLPDFVRLSLAPIPLTDPTLYVVLPDEPVSLDELGGLELGGPELGGPELGGPELGGLDDVPLETVPPPDDPESAAADDGAMTP